MEHKKVLANDGISPAGVARLTEAGYTVVTDKVEQADLAKEINEKGYSTLLVRSATTARKELIDACPGLRFIGRGGVGMDNIDVAYGREKGLEVTNTPSASSRSVAELVMGHMYASARFLSKSYCSMPEEGSTSFKDLKKAYAKGAELGGRTMGVIGFGRIGQETAKLAMGNGMRVLAFDPYSETDSLQLDIPGVQGKVEAKVERVDMKTLLAQSDFVSLHVPKQSDGSAVIGESELSLMKPTAVLVNAARGGVVDEDALLAALEAGRPGMAALDVFENEPTPRADILQHERILTTPHIGAATAEAQERIGTELADRIIAHFGA